jgi:carboxylate-amine ligase
VTLRFPEQMLLAHRFGADAPWRLGVEEELFLVDPATHDIRWGTDAVLARLRRPGLRGDVVGEMADGVVELATRISKTADDAIETLSALRQAVVRDGGVALLGAGLHPTAAFGDVPQRGGAHYEAVAADTRGVLRQSAYCGVHVHVGMPDPETAVVAYNGMRKWIPLLIALGAASPFWHGLDSGLVSARTVRCHSVPRTGLPRAFDDWADYCRTMGQLIRVAGIDGPGSLWWDMRPHPSLGTLELRALDAQSSLADLRGLIALVHCLARHEALTADDRHPSKELLDESTFLAVRDGLDARFSVGGPIRHVQDLARHALDLAAGYAPGLGCATALAEVERLLADGNGAQRQRRAFRAGGMAAVLRLLVDETAAGARVRLASRRTRPTNAGRDMAPA